MILLLITFIINSTLGIYIFTKGQNRKANQILAVIFLLLGWWALSLFMVKSALNPEMGVWWARAVFSGPFLLPTLFLWLSWFFPVVKKLTKTDTILFIFGIIFFLTFPFTVVAATNDVGYEFTFWSSKIFLVFFLMYMILAFVNFFKGYRQSRDLITKKHFQFFIAGLVLASLIGATTNLILPAVLEFRNWNNYGPLGTVFLSSLTSYAVVRHRFLNPRFVVKKYIIVALLLVLEIIIFVWFLQNTAVIKGISITATDNFWALTGSLGLLAVCGLYLINERLVTIFLPEEALDVTSLFVSNALQKTGKYSLEHFRNDAEKILQEEFEIGGIEFMVLEKGAVVYASDKNIKKPLDKQFTESRVVIKKDSIWGYTGAIVINCSEEKMLDDAQKQKLREMGQKIAVTLVQLYSINSRLAQGQVGVGFKNIGGK